MSEHRRRKKVCCTRLSFEGRFYRFGRGQPANLSFTLRGKAPVQLKQANLVVLRHLRGPWLMAEENLEGKRLNLIKLSLELKMPRLDDGMHVLHSHLWITTADDSSHKGLGANPRCYARRGDAEKRH